MSVLEFRTEITGLRDGLTSLLRKYKAINGTDVNQLSSLIKLIMFSRDQFTAILKLLPKARLYVTDYHSLAQGINVLRAKKVLRGSPELIVTCCFFVCNFTEPHFSKHHFRKLIADFDPETDADFVKEDIK